MVSKKIRSLVMLVSVCSAFGRADTQTRNDISVSLDDYVPYAHKYVVKEITSERFVREACVYPLKITVVNKADYPVAISTASIGGLPFVPAEKVASHFTSLRGVTCATLGLPISFVSGAVALASKKHKTFLGGISLLGTGIIGFGVYLYHKDKKNLIEEFKQSSVSSEPYIIQAGERYEGFIFLTKEAYNNQLCNITVAQAGNEENVTAFAFHL